MQTYHVDASAKYYSLDDIYYFGGTFIFLQYVRTCHACCCAYYFVVFSFSLIYIMCVRAYMCMCADVFVCMRARMCVCVCTCACVYVCIHVCMS